MNKFALLICGIAFAAVPFFSASAVPVRSDTGGECDSTGTERKAGRDEKGNKLDCKWETCKYTKCSTISEKPGDCVTKTEYSNPTDCKSASGRIIDKNIMQGTTTGTMATPAQTPRPTAPIMTVPAGNMKVMTPAPAKKKPAGSRIELQPKLKKYKVN